MRALSKRLSEKVFLEENEIKHFFVEEICKTHKI